MVSLLQLFRAMVLLLCCLFTAAGTNPASLHKEQGNERNMAIGDFEELNQLLRNAVVRLPDVEVSQNLITVDITNLRCQNFQVGDILVNATKDERQQVAITLTVQDLDLICYFDYEYNTLVFRGTGSANVESSNNDARAVTLFSSPTDVSSPAVKANPPTESSLESCDPQVNIDKMNFEGGILGIVLDRIESLLRNTMERLAEDMICDELGAMTTTGYVADFLILAQEVLDQYPPEVAESDPLAAEKKLQVPSGSELLNFQRQETELGKWVDAALKEAVLYLGTQTEIGDSTGGVTDMNINLLLRDSVLDQDGAYVLDVADLPFVDGVIWNGHDRFSETVITVNQVKLLGLDSFTKFEPLLSIGLYTFQTKLSWEYLAFEMDVTLDIKPSSLVDSIIEIPGSTNIVERVKIKFDVDNIEAAASFLVAVDQDALEDLTVGSLLQKDRVLPCFLSTLFHVELSDFTVDVRNILPPTLENFVSPGMDRLISRLARTGFLMYKESLLDSAPSFCQTTLRNLINKKISEQIESYVNSSACTALDLPGSQTGFVDFRDLFLSTEPYGDSISTVLMPMLQDEIIANGDDGLPLINSRLIQPFTKLNSGEEGTYIFASDLFRFVKEDFIAPWSPLLERVEMKGFNVTVRNLDTFVPPLSLLDPTQQHVLTNAINLEQGSSAPLNLTVSILLSVNGEASSPLNMLNEIDISVSIPSTALVVDILAKVREATLIDFPLRDLGIFQCWLYTIPYSEGEEQLALSNFSLVFPSLSFDANCVSCPDPAGDAVSEILFILEEAGFSTTLQKHLENLLDEAVRSFWQHLGVNRLLNEAPKLCPHSPDYDDSAGPIDLDPFSPPRSAIESILAVGSLVVQSLAIVSAKNHLSQPMPPSEALSGQASFILPEGSRILDWTNLSRFLGDWAEQAMDSARRYLGGFVEDFAGEGEQDLGANVLARSLLLDDDGMYTMDFRGIALEVAGFNLEIKSLRIHGLDSISRVNAFEVIGPQTFQNLFIFEKLEVMVDVDVSSAPSDTESMTISFGMSNATLDLAFLLAVDMDRLGELELGSFLVTEQVMGCILSIVHEMEVTQMILSVGGIENLEIDGFVPSELQASVSPLSTALFNAFRLDLMEAIPKISDMTGRAVVNGLLSSYIAERDSLCHVADVAAGFVDFRDLLLSAALSTEFGGSGNSPYGDVFQVLYEKMNQLLLNVDAGAGSSVNGLLGSWTKSQSNTTGSIVYPGDVVNTTAGISLGGLQANLEIKLSDARIENLDSFGAPLSLIRPVFDEPNSLFNNISVGVASKPVALSARVLIALYDNDDLQIRNEMHVRLDLSAVRVFVGVLLRIAEAPFFSFPLQDMFSLSCWLTTVFANPVNTTNDDKWDYGSVAINDYGVSIEQLGLNVSCISCTSPDFDKLVYQLYSLEGDENATTFVNNLVTQAGRIVGSDFFQERYLNEAAQQCPHSPEYDPNATVGESFAESGVFLFEKNRRDEKSVYFNVANACFAVVLCFLVGAWKLLMKWRNRKRVEALSTEDTAMLDKQQQMEQDLESTLNETTESMFRSPNFPRRTRIMVPFVLLLDIGLYLGGHLGVISTVNIAARVAGESVTINQFLDFAFVQSTIRTYANGGSEMAVLLFIFSGFWPYIKLVSSMVVFFLPPKKLSVSRRGTILLWLDVFAKLSIIDLFAMIVAIAALLVYAGGPDETIANDGQPFFVKLVVVPRGGFYSLLIAQRISRISSRFLLDYHREILDLGMHEYKKTHCKKAVQAKEEAARDCEGCPNCPNGDFDIDHVDDDHDVAEPHNTLENKRGIHIEIHDDRFAEEYDTADVWNGLHETMSPTDGTEKMLHPKCPSRWQVVCFGGAAGVVMTGLTVFSLGIIGCILAPAISVDTKPIWDVVEAGNTFEEAVTEYTVFRIVCLVLLQARFILNSASDYVGLGLLLAVAIVSAVTFPLMQFFSSLQRWWKERKSRTEKKTPASKSVLVAYVERLNAWKYVELYVIAFVIASWQLGAMSLYAIHYYCDFLERVYGMLVYVGIAEQSSAQCFRTQASHPSTVLVICGAFLILLATFLYSTAVQIRRNKASAISFEEDPPSSLQEEDIVDSEGCSIENLSDDGASMSVQQMQSIEEHQEDKVPELLSSSDDTGETASVASF